MNATIQAEKNGMPGHPAAGVNGIAEESLVDDLEAVHRKTSIRPVPYDEP